MTCIQYINTSKQLEKLCQQIAQESWLALDTEFLREKTYYPKFCLLQIATPDWVVCVDPLAFDNLNPLFEAIYNPEIIKVFHSCRQDLEIFYQLTGKIPMPLFDTQIAAPLLGIQENPGYAMLVSTFLNINLNKAYTRTDWSLRPLSTEQLRYAADDVIYLGQIYTIMHTKLTQLQRIDWLKNDFSRLNDPDLYDIKPENAWLKIKGKNKLTGKQLAIVQRLATWREQQVKIDNKPRNWLIRDDLLIELAKLQPTTVKELATVGKLNEHLLRRHGKILSQLINEAKQNPVSPLKDKKMALKKTQQQEAILDILTAVVRVRSEQNSLNPSILAPRKELEKLLFNENDCQLLAGWRFGMVGRELEELLSGHYSLKLDRKTIKISHTCV